MICGEYDSNILTWAKQKIRSPKLPQFDDSQCVVAVKEIPQYTPMEK